MAKNTLLTVLILSLMLEAVLTFHAFVDPNWLPQVVGLAPSAGAHFLNTLIAWFLAFVTMMIMLAIREIWRNDASGVRLSLCLGLWWIGIGFGIYFASGMAGNLITDSLKGTLLVGVSYWRWSQLRAR